MLLTTSIFLALALTLGLSILIGLASAWLRYPPTLPRL